MAGLKTIFATLTTDIKYADVEGVGVLRFENDRIYRWVTNPTTNYTPAAGDLVCHQFTDGTTAVQNVYKPATATLGFLAGVVCTSASANTGTNPFVYFWIQVNGENTTGSGCPIAVTTTATAGGNLVAANGVTYAVYGTGMGTAPIYQRTILLLDTPATTTTTTVNSYIKCL